MCFLKRFRSLNAKNLGSLGQRATKLLAVNVGGLRKKSKFLTLKDLILFSTVSKDQKASSILKVGFALSK